MSGRTRICLPVEVKSFLEFDGTKFVGLFSGMINDILDVLLSYKNSSAIIRSQNDGFGEANPLTGLYDGCIGLLQKNKSDLLLSSEDFPHIIENTKQEVILFTREIMFFTSYYPIDEVQEVGVESCYMSFSPIVWLMCLITISIIHFLYIIRSKVIVAKYFQRNFEKMWRRCSFKTSMTHKIITEKCRKKMKKNQNNLFNLISHMLRLGCLNNSKGLFNKIIFSILSIFSLIVVHYFVSYIKTELVTINPPKIYRSYEDLVENNIFLIFTKAYSHYTKFKFAPEGSPERTLWDRSIKKYFDLFPTLGEPERAVAMLRDVFDQKAVIITDEVISSVCMKEYCQNTMTKAALERSRKWFNITNEKIPYPYTAQDPKETNVPIAIIFNSNFNGYAYKEIRKNSIILAENGLILNILSKTSETDVSGMGNTRRSNEESTEYLQCRSGKIKIPYFHLQGIRLNHFEYILIYLLVLLTIALFTFLTEITVK